MDFGQEEDQRLATFQENQYNAQDQLGLGEPLDVADNFPYSSRHRSHTFVQPLSNPMFNGLGATNAQPGKPRDSSRPRNSFDLNETGLELTQQGFNQMQKDRYEQGEPPPELRNSRYGLNRSNF